MGFEPTRAEHIGLAVQRLNHSATSSHAVILSFGPHMCDNKLLLTQAAVQVPAICCLLCMCNDVSGQPLSVSTYTTSLRHLIRGKASLLFHCQVTQGAEEFKMVVKYRPPLQKCFRPSTGQLSEHHQLVCFYKGKTCDVGAVR